MPQISLFTNSTNNYVDVKLTFTPRANREELIAFAQHFFMKYAGSYDDIQWSFNRNSNGRIPSASLRIDVDPSRYYDAQKEIRGCVYSTGLLKDGLERLFNSSDPKRQLVARTLDSWGV